MFNRRLLINPGRPIPFPVEISLSAITMIVNPGDGINMARFKITDSETEFFYYAQINGSPSPVTLMSYTEYNITTTAPGYDTVTERKVFYGKSNYSVQLTPIT